MQRLFCLLPQDEPYCKANYRYFVVCLSVQVLATVLLTGASAVFVIDRLVLNTLVRVDWLLVHCFVLLLQCTVFHPLSSLFRWSLKKSGNFVFSSSVKLLHSAPFHILCVGTIVESVIYCVVKSLHLPPDDFVVPCYVLLALELVVVTIFLVDYIGCVKYIAWKNEEPDALRLIRSLMDPYYGTFDNLDYHHSLVETQGLIIEYLRRRLNNLIRTTLAVDSA